MIGHGWDDGTQWNSYWIRCAGRCRLVPAENLRYATLEECLSQEQLLAKLRDSITQLSEEKKPFEFDDPRIQRERATLDNSAPETSLTTRPNASVPPGQGVSISEAVGRYYGPLPKLSRPMGIH